MCLINRLHSKALVILESFIIFAIAIAHLGFGFILKFKNFSEFKVYELFDSSPLFDFSLENICKNKSAVIFHRWKGRRDYSHMFDYESPDSYIRDATDIKKINGKFFCFRNISYKDLLNNGQIIKKGSECPLEYHKNCGRLDTLEQELCIKENEKCPLYDIGIGNKSNDKNYIYDEISKVYYNNENYNKENKTIIGSLVLNEGQPCYNTSEKLWRRFIYEEVGKNHLICDMEVFGKYNDERYENKGNISYKRLYEDNLNSYSREMIFRELTGKEEVSLYKREFLGIDKKCDENYILTKDSYDYFHDNIQSESTLLLVEGFLHSISGLIAFIGILCVLCRNTDKEDFKEMVHPGVMCIFYCMYMVMFIPCFVLQIIFFSRIKKYDLYLYNCSDSTTNESIRKGAGDDYKQYIYCAINFFLDLFLATTNFLAILIGLILMKNDKLKEKSNKQKESKEQCQDKSIEKSDINHDYEINNPEIPLNNYYPDPN